jgi:DNA-binding winged helix-turn-helix (wHTH) protein
MTAGEPSGPVDLGGGYVLDPLTHVLTRGDRVARLSPLASRLLQLLAKRPGEVVERTEIIEALWKGDWLTGDPALTRLVSELRRDTADDPRRPALIQTVPRRGYRLVTQMSDTPIDAAAAAAPEALPWWQTAWRLANQSLLIMIGGAALIMALAILVRLSR